jgi:hypothetical protein
VRQREDKGRRRRLGEVITALGLADEVAIAGPSPTSSACPAVATAFDVKEAVGRYYGGTASDIHVEPQERDVRVRFRIDGLLRGVPSHTGASSARSPGGGGGIVVDHAPGRGDRRPAATGAGRASGASAAPGPGRPPTFRKRGSRA